ncbi:MAG: hypothetical protein ABR540_03430 [Acidimicrobiales bacterium]|nr:hypothetical protein [Actinomycetota bacterium]
MEVLWFIPVLALLGVGLYFLIRSFIKLQAAIKDVRSGLSDLGDMGPRLSRLGEDVSHLAESLEEKRRQ